MKTFREYREALGLDADEFCARYPNPVFVHSGRRRPLQSGTKGLGPDATIDRFVLEGKEPHPGGVFDDEWYSVLELVIEADTSLTIGSSPEANLRLDDQSLSRLHARVRMAGDDLEIQDAGSVGGTAVNGRVLAPDEWAPLSSGVRVTLSYVELLFCSQVAFYAFLLGMSD